MDLEKLTLPLEVADKAFNIGIGAAIAGVTALIGAMSLGVKKTFEWADQLDSIQDVIGGTNTEAAALNFTLRKSGTATDVFNKSMVIMSKGLVKADGSLDTVGKAMSDWGIDVKDANGNLKSQQQLIGDVSKKYGTFATQQEKVNFLTEVFGRGGAEMIDFFDTLSQEGGIDAVTQKVKDLGLVIDPQRYENFTRSLEEIKLAGLGLAISMTEKLMPMFEGILMWAQQFQGMTPEQIFSRIVAEVDALPEKIQNILQNIDWEVFSQNLITGINSIDWNALGQWVGRVHTVLRDGIIDMFKGMDWSGLFSSIGTAFMEFATGLAGSDFATFKAVWQSNWDSAVDIVYGFVQETDAAVVGWLRSLPGKITLYFVQALGNLKVWIGKMVSAFSPLTNLMSDVAAGAAGAAGGATGGTTGGDTTPGRASGGYGSGMTWVGERGPELVNLPSGSYVNNNVSSSRMAQGSGQVFISDDQLDTIARTFARVVGQQMQRA